MSVCMSPMLKFCLIPRFPKVTHSYPRLPKATQCYPRLPKFTKGYQRLPKVTKGYQRLLKVSKGHPRLLKVNQGYPRLPRLLKVTQGYPRLLKVTQDTVTDQDKRAKEHASLMKKYFSGGRRYFIFSYKAILCSLYIVSICFNVKDQNQKQSY